MNLLKVKKKKIQKTLLKRKTDIIKLKGESDGGKKSESSKTGLHEEFSFRSREDWSVDIRIELKKKG